MAGQIHTNDLKQAVNQSRAEVKHPDGCVYVVRWRNYPDHNRLWKIGMTRKLKRRLKELKCTYKDGLEVHTLFQINVRGDCAYLEQVLHRLYGEFEHTIDDHREWFDIGGAEIAWLRSLRAIDCTLLRENVRNLPRKGELRNEINKN